MLICLNCLGTGRCWICDGAGCTPSVAGSHRCSGDGVCRLCLQRLPAQREPDEAALSRP